MSKYNVGDKYNDVLTVESVFDNGVVLSDGAFVPFEAPEVTTGETEAEVEVTTIPEDSVQPGESGETEAPKEIGKRLKQRLRAAIEALNDYEATGKEKHYQKYLEILAKIKESK